LTLASGVVPNNPGNLGGWISDPHSLNPGNLMPPTSLSGEDLNALIAYLQALK
jgi:cytochrome c oxidase subunit 2